MDINNIIKELQEIYQTSKFNPSLLLSLNGNDISDAKTSIKTYLLKFLINVNDTTEKDATDFWFSKYSIDNMKLIEKYIKFSIKYIKEMSNKEITECSSLLNEFLPTEIGKKLTIIYLILEKVKFPLESVFLFLGFLIGSSKPFIRNDYLDNIFNLYYFYSLNEDLEKENKLEYELDYVGNE